MNLNLETEQFDNFEALENFIRSLSQKRFGHLEFISTIDVKMKKTDDPRVPWLAEIEVSPDKGASMLAEARSSNYLTAFSQAVNRMERQVEKYRDNYLRSRA